MSEKQDLQPGELSKGVKRNTRGQPDIAKHRIRMSHTFMNRMRADFQKHGIAAIEEVRKKNPVVYLQIVAQMVPQQLDVNVQHSFVDVLLEAQRRAKAQLEAQTKAEGTPLAYNATTDVWEPCEPDEVHFGPASKTREPVNDE